MPDPQGVCGEKGAVKARIKFCPVEAGFAHITLDFDKK
jgi:hypothetical protein